MSPLTIGISLKMYFGRARTAEWCRAIADLARTHPAVTDDLARLVVLPSHPYLLEARILFGATPVRTGGQDLFWNDEGAFTGEVSGARCANSVATTSKSGTPNAAASSVKTTRSLRPRRRRRSATGSYHCCAWARNAGRRSRPRRPSVWRSWTRRLLRHPGWPRDRWSWPTSRCGRSAPPSPHHRTTSWGVHSAARSLIEIAVHPQSRHLRWQRQTRTVDGAERRRGRVVPRPLRP